jgi:ABC-2 type transport system permease protein
MSRMLLVARHEYLRHVRRRGFLLATFGLPLLLLSIIGVVILVLVNNVRPERAIGYVDQSGLLNAITLPAPGADSAERVPLLAFPNQNTAEAALAAGQIDAYALIPPTYAASGQITIYGREALSAEGMRSLQAALNQGLLAQAALPPEVAARALDPLGEVEVRSLAGGTVDRLALAGRMAVAIIGSLLFMVTVFSSAGYLLQALVEEKENRTMELVTTAISPGQLLGGKTLGLGLLGLSIAAAWLVGVAIAWGVGAAFFAPLRELRLSLELLVPAALFLPLGFMLFAGLMVAISAVMPTAQDSQQLAGLVNLVAVIPLIVSGVFFSSPDGALATGLSLFPLSAPVAMLLRLVLGSVPAWQLALSLALLAITAGLVIWGAARLFRAGMLRYGQRLGPREALRALGR